MKNKKIKKIIIIFSIIISIGVVLATDHYRLNKNSSIKIVEYNTCLKNTSYNDYFIPTKTNNEWYNFKNHLPSGVSIITCESNPPADGENYWEIRYKNRDRTSAHPTCGSITKDALIVVTPFGDHFSRETNAESITSVIIDGTRVYKAQLDNPNYGQCSPLYDPARRKRRIRYTR